MYQFLQHKPIVSRTQRACLFLEHVSFASCGPMKILLDHLDLAESYFDTVANGDSIDLGWGGESVEQIQGMRGALEGVTLFEAVLHRGALGSNIRTGLERLTNELAEAHRRCCA